ncbi:MAG: WxcM-like domain-containing protein [Nanoarchaeota archaeon]
MTEKRFEIKTIEPAFSDDRGDIFNILESEFDIRHVEYYTSVKGTTRGNHYHPNHNEAIFMISGLCQIVVKNLENSDPNNPESGLESRVVGPNSLIICRAKVVHAQVFLEDSKAIAFSDKRKDKDRYSEHTIRYQIA